MPMVTLRSSASIPALERSFLLKSSPFPLGERGSAGPVLPQANGYVRITAKVLFDISSHLYRPAHRQNKWVGYGNVNKRFVFMNHYFRHPPSLSACHNKVQTVEGTQEYFLVPPLKFQRMPDWRLAHNHLIGQRQVQGTLRIKGVPGITAHRGAVSSWWWCLERSGEGCCSGVVPTCSDSMTPRARCGVHKHFTG